MATKIKTSDTLPGFGSDHAAPALTINLTKKKGGRGFWKLNTSLLAEEAYREIITNCIEQTIKDNENTDPILLWDTIKCRIRGTSIKYASRKKRQNINKYKGLEDLLTTANKQLDLLDEVKFPHIRRVLQAKIRGIQGDIFQYIDSVNRGHMIRSRVAYYEEGEKCSKFFLGLEKWRGDSKCIKSLKKDDGSEINESNAILKEEKSFYSKLYSSNRYRL